ncbi:hypothetical protein NW754_014621 [Fusarium falciforme]|nr:hypothetical protein NW754_014621 [Fusarium falciforme]
MAQESYCGSSQRRNLLHHRLLLRDNPLIHNKHLVRSCYSEDLLKGQATPWDTLLPKARCHQARCPIPAKPPTAECSHEIQIPQNQQQWAPGMQPPTPQGFRPGPVPPQGPQSAGPKEGKGGKWFKLFKGGSKSTAPTPTTPIVSSPVTAINNAPRDGVPGQAPQSGQMPPEPVRGPGNAAPGQVPPGQGNMPPQPGHMAAQPSQMPQPSQIPTQPVPGPGRAPPGQGPPGPGQMAPQSGQMPIQPGQMGPKPGQVPTQPSQMGPQRGQAPPGMGQVPPGPSQIAMQPGQRPLGPGQMPPQSDPKPLLPGEMAPQPGRIPSGHMSPPNPQAPPAGAARISPSPSAGHIPANGPSQIAPLSSPSKAGPSNAHQNLPSQIPPPGQNSVSRPPQPMPVPQTRTPEPHQSKNIPAPLRPDTLRASPEPPLASSPGLSDAGLSSMSRVSSHQKRDSLSDAGSITTIEVSEAKPQPVLRPSIVQVHRRSTDMFRKSEEIQRNMEALANADAAPRGSSDTSRFEQPLTIQKAPSPAPNVQPQQPISRPGSATPRDALERSLSPAPLFSKSGSPKPAQNGPSSRQENNMEPTPLFSKPNPPVSAVSGLPSQQMKPAPIVQQQPPPETSPSPCR